MKWRRAVTIELRERRNSSDSLCTPEYFTDIQFSIRQPSTSHVCSVQSFHKALKYISYLSRYAGLGSIIYAIDSKKTDPLETQALFKPSQRNESGKRCLIALKQSHIYP